MGPAGWPLLTVLALAFVGCAVLMVRGTRVVVQGLAAAAAFLLAATFGIGTVNTYFDYYQTWGSVWADLSANTGNAPVAALPPGPAPAPAAAPVSTSSPGQLPPARPVTATGQVIKVNLPGPQSGVTGRRGLVWLPPQYADPAYGAVRFPVLELIHGDPGQPSSFTNGLGLPQIAADQLRTGAIGPFVVVMPDVTSPVRDQQCLDGVTGPKIDTYLSRDVPQDLTGTLRVQPAGPGWAVAGLSEGGFCAANLALRHPETYRAAASIDGYYQPALTTKLTRRLFGADTSLAVKNNPTELVARWPAGRPLPPFWIMAGTGNPADYRAATSFATLLSAREQVRFVSVIGGRHTTPAFRAATPDLLRWAWVTLSGGTLTGQVQVPLG